MIPLSIEEVVYEVTMSETAAAEKKDLSMAVKLKAVAEELGLDADKSMADQVKESYEKLGLDADYRSTLPQKVKELYSMVHQLSPDCIAGC